MKILKGKRVGVGQVGSGVEQSAKKVLEAADLTYDDLSKVTHTGYADSVQEMKNGTIGCRIFHIRRTEQQHYGLNAAE